MVPHVAVRAQHSVLGRDVLEGEFAGQPAVLAQTGVSMVNAAMTTQALLDRFTIGRIIVSGIAGGLDPRCAVGQVLAPAQWGQFLEVGMGRETGAGYTLPPLPGMTDRPGFGMMIPRDVIVASPTEPEHARQWIDADPALLDLARSIDGITIGGAGVSGTAFVDNARYRDYLHGTTGASVLDMESAAIAQVAFANAVPFIVLRALSDLAGGEADANHLPHWIERACANVSRATRTLVGALPG